MEFLASLVSETIGGERRKPPSLNRTIRIMELAVEGAEADDGSVLDLQESTVRRRRIVALVASRQSLRL